MLWSSQPDPGVRPLPSDQCSAHHELPGSALQPDGNMPLNLLRTWKERKKERKREGKKERKKEREKERKKYLRNRHLNGDRNRFESCSDPSTIWCPLVCGIPWLPHLPGLSQRLAVGLLLRLHVSTVGGALDVDGAVLVHPIAIACHTQFMPRVDLSWVGRGQRWPQEVSHKRQSHYRTIDNLCITHIHTLPFLLWNHPRKPNFLSIK